MIVIDERKVFEIIEERKPTSVALNGPDGILPKVQDLALKIGKKFGIPAYLLADTRISQGSFSNCAIEMSLVDSNNTVK